MNWILFVLWSTALAVYFHWVGYRNGRDMGIKLAGELWPDVGLGVSLVTEDES